MLYLKKVFIFFICIMVLFLFPNGTVRALDDMVERIVKIAVIDTGISTSAIDSEKIGQGYNYIEDNEDTEDLIGHGTAIAGILVGDRLENVKGIIPNALLIPLVCQTKDRDNKVTAGNHEILARAIRDAIDLFDCRIINISNGVVEESAILHEAVKYAEEKNVLVIASVGNSQKENPNALYYPAAYSAVIGVGSVNSRGQISTFSQRNQSVNIMAEGEKIWTISKNGKQLMTQGTSYATAYVTGAVATLLSTRPTLTANQVRNILYGSAKDIHTKGYDTDSGWGIIQMTKALEWAESIPSFPKSIFLKSSNTQFQQM